MLQRHCELEKYVWSDVHRTGGTLVNTDSTNCTAAVDFRLLKAEYDKTTKTELD
jgi:hypothetical protein